jgi:hypothetical protein
MVMIILSGSLVTCFITLHTIWPFFAYSLYAFPEKDQKEYRSVEIILNGKPFYFYREMSQTVAASLENSANHYIYLRENSFTDPYYKKLSERNVSLPRFLDPIFKYNSLSDQKFSNWIKDYIELHTNYKITKLKINNIYIEYTPNAKVTKRTAVFERAFK